MVPYFGHHSQDVHTKKKSALVASSGFGFQPRLPFNFEAYEGKSKTIQKKRKKLLARDLKPT